MEHGRIVRGPWGEYRVDARDVLVLRSVERCAAIIDPSAALLACFTVTDRFAPNRAQSKSVVDPARGLVAFTRAGVDDVHSQVSGDACSWVDRTPALGVTNGGERAVTGGRDPISSEASAVPADGNVARQRDTEDRSLPCHADASTFSLTLGGMRPGSVRMFAGDHPLRWTPCLTRAEGSIWEHCWFLDHGESLYCHQCRARKPTVVIGRADRIARIRHALEAGDHELAHELVRRIHDPARMTA